MWLQNQQQAPHTEQAQRYINRDWYRCRRVGLYLYPQQLRLKWVALPKLPRIVWQLLLNQRSHQWLLQADWPFSQPAPHGANQNFPLLPQTSSLLLGNYY